MLIICGREKLHSSILSLLLFLLSFLLILLSAFTYVLFIYDTHDIYEARISRDY